MAKPTCRILPFDDPKRFARMVRAAKPRFRAAAPVQLQYENLHLDASGGCFTGGAVRQELYRRIGEVLHSGLAERHDLRALEKHFVLKSVLDNVEVGYVLDLLSILRDATRDQGWPCPHLDSPAWSQALELAATCFETLGQRGFGSSEVRTTSVACAAKQLRVAGFHVRVAIDRIDAKASETQIFAELDKLASKIGGIRLAELVFEELKQDLDPVQVRYHVVRRTSTTGVGAQDPLVPYGYLLNLAIKHVSVAGAPIEARCYSRLRELSTALAAVYDVQPYYAFDGRFNDRKSIIRYLQSVAAFDALFTFPQSNPRYVPDLLSELFASFDKEKVKRALGVDLSTLVAVSRAVLSDPPQGPMLFNAPSIAESSGVSVHDADCALGCLSHDNSPNESFIDPLGNERARFSNFPLLRVADGFLLVDAAFCAPAFYDAIRTRLQDGGIEKVDECLGHSFERLAFRRLASRGIAVHSGKYRSKLLGDGECDAVVETSGAVIFLEFKKKCLTRKARSAQDAAILADLTGALLEPHWQTGRHELALTAESQLLLRGGRSPHTIELAGRKIERLAISLPEFGAFHSREVSTQVLNLFTGVSISAPNVDPDIVHKINKTCARLGSNYTLALKLNVHEPGRFFNCWFLGLDALLTLLENVDSSETFWRELKRTRHLSTGSLNWHFDYQWAHGLDPKLAEAADRTGATVAFGA